MAVKNLSPSSTSRSHQLLLLLCLAVSRHVPCARSLSFSYSAFNPDDFKPEADARVKDGRLELLGDEFAARARGRAWHKQPMQLWDGATGKSASFAANFTFSIQSVPAGKGAPGVGHGMTFFLAPYTPDLPQESYDGCLGLFDESQKDSYATVMYDNGTRRLDVALIVGSDTYTAAATVDLPSLLPEHVAVGFSAATGDAYASKCSRSPSSRRCQPRAAPRQLLPRPPVRAP